MSNTEPNPQERVCDSSSGLSDGVELRQCEQGPLELLEPRAVPLGGPRAMTVYRALPQKARSLIGAWCFCDAFGPDTVAKTQGMKVPRHPHTGLATVSWLFAGGIDHIDSAGHWAKVLPGWVNLMNAGSGITHSEFSSADTETLHGLQLWYALPASARFSQPSLQSFQPQPIRGKGFTARVFLGSLLGYDSPVQTPIGLTGAEFRLAANARLELEVPEDYEHGLVQVSGPISLDAVQVPDNAIAFTPRGRKKLTIAAGDRPALAVLLGGEPLGEEIVMWWNFVGRSHEEIALWRSRYMQEMGFERASAGSVLQEEANQPLVPKESPEASYEDGTVFPQFGQFPPQQPAPLPAPPLPQVRLRLRGPKIS